MALLDVIFLLLLFWPKKKEQFHCVVGKSFKGVVKCHFQDVK